MRSRILQNLGPKQNSVLPLKKNKINEFKKRRKNTPRPWKLSFTRETPRPEPTTYTCRHPRGQI